jgi:hypothetical protein
MYNGTIVGDIGTADEVIGGGSTGDFGISSRAGSIRFGLNGNLGMTLASGGALTTVGGITCTTLTAQTTAGIDAVVIKSTTGNSPFLQFWSGGGYRHRIQEVDGAAGYLSFVSQDGTGYQFDRSVVVSVPAAVYADLTLARASAGQRSGVRLEDGSSTKYNWFVGTQNYVDNGFEVSRSSVVGGTTYSSVMFKIDAATGVATFPGGSAPGTPGSTDVLIGAGQIKTGAGITTAGITVTSGATLLATTTTPASGSTGVSPWVSGSVSLVSLVSSGAAADEKIWDVRHTGTTFQIRAAADNYSASNTGFAMSRSGSTISGIGFFGATPVAKPSMAAATGTATRTTFDTTTVTTAQLAERVKALIDDLRAYGLEG